MWGCGIIIYEKFAKWELGLQSSKHDPMIFLEDQYRLFSGFA
jgi:hypothetical protein